MDVDSYPAGPRAMRTFRRVRGEVDIRASARMAGEGAYRRGWALFKRPLTPTRLRPADYGGQALSPLSAEALAKAERGERERERIAQLTLPSPALPVPRVRSTASTTASARDRAR